MRRHFDVLVVGAGPAGVSAAVRATESGMSVALCDENPSPGGQVWRRGGKQPSLARQWMARLEASAVVRLQGWHVFGQPGPGVLLAERNSVSSPSAKSECAELRYGNLILATGARERYLPFPGWTLPNVMGAGGLDAMARGGLPVGGKRVVVAGTGPLLLAVAAQLAHHGANILAICEQAPRRRLVPFAARLLAEFGKLAQGIGYRFAARSGRYYTSCWPVAAKGNGKLETVRLERNGKQWEMACDYLACGFHLVPNLELAMLLGCCIQDGYVAVDQLQRTSIPDVFCVGEPTGIGGVELSILEGEIAGLAAAGRAGEARTLIRCRSKRQPFVRALVSAFSLDPRLRGLPSDETIVCRCEDVTFGALRRHESGRDAKLQTRCGMGPCQGRVCGPATEFLFGWNPDSVRPPVLPVFLSSLAPAASAAGLISNEHGEKE
jgi:D-hydroxyproline dehydrogenase subunit alpha